MATTVDIQEFINSRKLSGYQINVLVLCFLVVAVDGQPVASSRDLIKAISAVAPGSDVRLGVMRDGQPMDVVVAVGRRPDGKG